MTLQQLRYAIMVADNCSMSEAAKSLFISQPTLSNAIKDLELEIGISLFVRNNKGITVTSEGREFLGYARQIIQQTSLLEEKYLGQKPQKIKFSVSTQHYSFAVNAFVDLIKDYEIDEYDFQLRETRTYEIIEDVNNMNSEIGVLYLNSFNKKVISKIFKEKDVEFHQLFCAKPHVFISNQNPLVKKEKLKLEDLIDYPYLSFEQGNNNSFYFSEEILSTINHNKSIRVSDRATLFNFLIGLDGFTLCTGVISEELNGKNIVSKPLDVVGEEMYIGYIVHKNVTISKFGEIYIEKLKALIKEYL